MQHFQKSKRINLSTFFTVPFYRYYNGAEHFYTTDATEIGTTTVNVVGDYGYKFEGIAGSIYQAAGAGLVPLYRYYNNKEHFYTTSAGEIGTTTIGETGKHGYHFEGIAGYCFASPAEGVKAFHRYYNGKDHFYTTNPEEIGTTTVGSVGKFGYKYEGVACYLKP